MPVGGMRKQKVQKQRKPGSRRTWNKYVPRKRSSFLLKEMRDDEVSEGHKNSGRSQGCSFLVRKLENGLS